MMLLPVEILQRICELSAEEVVTHPYGPQHTIEAVDSINTHFTPLLGFSQASWTCREVSAPYLFRRLRVRTAEQASVITESPIAKYARHIHFPVVDALTCRRPIHHSVSQLISQATSIRISASNPSFFYTARTLLSSLLRSAKELLALELYCGRVTYGLDTLGLIGKNLIPTCPKSLRALSITMPGGQPDYTGPDALLGALSSSPSCTRIDNTLSELPELEFIHLSTHLTSQISSCPIQLALKIAQRLPALRHVSLVPYPRVQQKVSSYELSEPRGEPRDARRSELCTSWWVVRDACTDGECIDPQAEDGVKLEISSLAGVRGW